MLNTRAFEQPLDFGTRSQSTFALDVGAGLEMHGEVPGPPLRPGTGDSMHQADAAHDQDSCPANQHLGKTVLHLAAEYGHLGVVQLLIERLGGNIDLRDGMGDTALHHATRHSHLPVVEELVAVKASLDIPNSAGRTPLQVSVMNGDAAMVQFLLDHGANIL